MPGKAPERFENPVAEGVESFEEEGTPRGPSPQVRVYGGLQSVLFVWEKTVRSGMCMGGAPVICVGDAISCLSACLPLLSLLLCLCMGHCLFCYAAASLAVFYGGDLAAV